VKTVLAFLAFLGLVAPAAAGDAVGGYGPSIWPHIVATISLSKQEMQVSVETADYHQATYNWKISTGRKGFETPTGQFTPLWADADHHSSLYENAPMPYAVFFTQGYAVHGTPEVNHLGQPASHGCVRLETANAEAFFDYVNDVGKLNTKIVITN
jgi:lipoprotein-anchoring transpeptidase ErfK/SrfK